ncbi:hypothetical protein [Paractinoplanes durhamensis]|uniref:hypothetical protein n=1 Tax=Paractinoplanes durhamensis TaxID=113563 RepID=UPI00194386C2|nr:hypothetical protein [Actinoplanes durhamensis]
MPTAEIALRFPNGVMHNCYHFHQNPRGVVEPVVYPEHPYRPSTNRPEGARVPLCAVCRGTHGDDEVEGGGLLLSTGRPRLILPGEIAEADPSGLILPGNR